MEHTYRKRAEAFLKRHGKKRIWHGALTAMAAVVVFITSYMLILPAITLSQEPVCGLEAHTHTAQCNPLYDEETGGWIYSCGLEAHVHTDACYPQAEPEPVYYCGLDEHVHGADCYKLDTLICMQTEHIHGAECLQPRTAEPVETGNVEMAESGDSPIQLGVRLIEMDDAKIRQMLEEWLNEQKSRQEDEVPGSQPESYPAYSSSASAGDVSDNDVSGNDVSGGDVSGGDVSGNNAAPTGGSPYAGAPAAAPREVSGGDVTWGDVAGGDVPEYDAEIFDEEEAFRNSRMSNIFLEYKEAATPLTHEKYNLKIADARFNSTEDFYEAGMTFTFSVDPNQVVQDGRHYKLTLPDGMYPTQGLLKMQQDYGGFFEAKDEGGNVGFRAKFVEDATGQWYIDIVWDEGYVETALSGSIVEKMECFLQFDCELDKSGYDKETGKLHYYTEDLTVEWEPGHITYPDESETAAYDIHVAKSGSYDSANNVLTYTVTVSSQKGTPGNIDLSDILNPSTLELLGEQTGTVKVEKTAVNEWNNPYGDRTLVENGMRVGADGKLSGTLPQLGEREAYVITYTYQLEELPEGFERETVNNSVTVQSDNGIPGGKVKDDEEIGVTVEKKAFGKSGQYDESTSEIEWTIRVNEDKKDIAGKTLSDPMFAQMVVDSFSISPNANWHWVEGGKTIQFDAPEGEAANTQCYDIKFRTKVDQSKLHWGDNVFENTAEFDGGTVSAQVTVTAGEVEKEVSEITPDDTKTVIQWKVSVKVPRGGFPAPGEGQDAVTVTDRLDVTANGGESSRLDHYMTWSQVEALKNALAGEEWFTSGVGTTAEQKLRVKYYEWGKPDPENQWYYTWIEVESTYAELSSKSPEELASMQFIGFSFDFVNGLAGGEEEQTLVITYESTAETAGVTKDKTFRNKVDVEGKEKWAPYEFRRNVVKTDGNSSEADNQKTLERGEDGKYRLNWRVRVIVQEGQTYLEVLDTLPAGVELEKLTLVTADYKKAELTWNEETGAITDASGILQDIFDLSGSQYTGQEVLLILSLKEDAVRPDWFQAGKELWINYDCVLTDAEAEKISKQLNTKQDYVGQYENSVSVKFSKSQAVPETDRQKQEVTVKPPEEVILDKFGNYRANGSSELSVWDNGNRRLMFHVDINPEGEDLLEGADTLTLTDELHLQRANGNIAFSALLMPANVKLWYAEVDESGQPIRDEFGKLKASDRQVPMGQGEGCWSWTYSIDTTQEQWNTGKDYYIIKAVIPDGVALVFEYEYTVSAKDTNATDEEYDIFTSTEGNETRLWVSGNNIATLEGVSKSTSDVPFNKQYESASFSAGVSMKGSYTFYKVDSKDYGTVLQGAKFRLYRYDSTTAEWVDTGQVYETDENGSFVIRDKKDSESSDFDFAPNTLYYVIEEVAPVGYEIPEPKIPYYFQFSDKTVLESSRPEGWESLGAVDLTLQPQVVYCANEKLPELEVEKEWLSLDGAKINQSTGKVRFELYRRTVSSEAVTDPNEGETSGGTDIGGDGGGFIEWNIKDHDNQSPPKEEGVPRVVFSRINDNSMFYYRTFDTNLVGQKITITLRYTWYYETWGKNITELNVSNDKPDNNLSHSENSGEDGFYKICFTLTEDTDLYIQANTGDKNNWVIVSVTATSPTNPGESPTEPDVRPGDVLMGTYEITPEKDSEGNWLWKWKSGDVVDLTLLRSEVKDNVRYQYAYYVKEISVYADSGSEGENLIGSYTVNYSENNTDGLANGGTIKITNTSKEGYSLPMTGGAGTRLYILGGLFATALAGLLLYRKSRRKEERFSS